MKGSYFYTDNSLETHRQEAWVIEEVIYSANSGFQKIDVIKLKKLGKALFLDHGIQFSEFDEAHYHELFVHPACSIINPRSALVLGGGDGGCVRELLRHKSIESVTVCEIDRKVVEVVHTFFPNMGKFLFDNRVSLIFEDASKFICTSSPSYDLILIDLTDLGRLSENLYTSEFLTYVSSRLTERGCVVIQTSGIYFFDDDDFNLYSFVKNLKTIFKHVNVSYVPIYSFPGGDNSFTYCSNVYDFSSYTFPKLSFEADLKFYTNKYAESTFNINNWLQNKLKEVNV